MHCKTKMQFSPECALFSLGLPVAMEVSAAERSGVAVPGVVAGRPAGDEGLTLTTT